MTKRAAFKLEALAAESEPAHAKAEPVVSPLAQAGPEPMTTIYARVPWTLGERMRDLARERSKAAGRRVTVNDLVIEALSKLAS